MTEQSANRERRRMPTVNRIVEYWRRQEVQIAVEWNEATDHCWRCGKHLIRVSSARHSEDPDFPHRAHIVPRALGGKDDASNLIVLCRSCHAQAPDVADKEFMWEWLRRSSLFSSRHLQITRDAFLEYERLFGRFPLPKIVFNFATFGVGTSLSPLDSELTHDEEADFSDPFLTAFQTAFTFKSNLICPHAGELSVSTVVWVIRQSVLYAERKPCFISAHTPDSCKSADEGGKQPSNLQKTLFDLLSDVQSD